MTGRITLLLAAVLIGLLPAFAVPARGQGVDGRGELQIERPPGGALVGEMLLLTFRAIVRGRIANRDVRQPSLADLDWQQLGRDAWSEVFDGNSRAYAFERTVAVFPRREGQITIDPFVLVLTMLGDDNSRYEAEVPSTPLTFEVRSLGSGERLVHARSLSVADRWDKPPDRLASGETARRTVTIEAAGTVAERLPPAPSMRTPGVIAFAAPVERVTTLTDKGPVARVVYRWDVKPISADPAVIPARTIAWFDTVSREPKEAIIPEQRVGLAPVAPGRAAAAVPQANASVAQGVIVGFLSAIWLIAAVHLLGATRTAARAAWRRRALLRPLRVAARANDPRAFRTALSALMQADVASARACNGPDLRNAIAALDVHLFGRGDRPSPALDALCRGLDRALRADQTRVERLDAALAPIDAPLR
jgi:hypothetical protein